MTWYEKKVEQYGWFSRFLPREVRRKLLDYHKKIEKSETAKYKKRKAELQYNLRNW